jgi:putative FmdB family regulatory protein
MPTYEYECRACHRRLEVVQRFNDPAVTTCESCGGELRKVFSAVGIVFKGSGFYKNDSRSSRPATSPAPPASPASPADTPSPAPVREPASSGTGAPAASATD